MLWNLISAGSYNGIAELDGEGEVVGGVTSGPDDFAPSWFKSLRQLTRIMNTQGGYCLYTRQQGCRCSPASEPRHLSSQG